MKYKAILFDLDGTILNTIPDLWHSANYALTVLGFPERTLAEVNSFVGNGVRMLMKRALPENVPEDIWNESVRLQKSYYDKNLAVETKPYEGIPELLSKLKEEGYLLGTVSNKYDEAVKSLMDIYYPGVFDVALGSRDDIPLKPDRAMTDYALRTIGVLPSETVYVGDSEVDYSTAVNGQMFPVLVDWGFRTREVLEKTGAKTIISHPSDLLDLL